MSEFYECRLSPDKRLSFVMEDDGRVAYGYLLQTKQIVGHVWLYNQQRTPERPEWGRRSGMPCMNPKEFVDQPNEFVPVTMSEELECEWVITNGQSIGVSVLLRGDKHATIAINEMPGYSRFACVDGPLAKRMSRE
jgi:hypothetical protein